MAKRGRKAKSETQSEATINPEVATAEVPETPVSEPVNEVAEKPNNEITDEQFKSEEPVVEVKEVTKETTDDTQPDTIIADKQDLVDETQPEIPVIEVTKEELPEPVVEVGKKIDKVLIDTASVIHQNISKIILELKKKPMYKYLSKTSLIRIAGDILKNGYIWK